MTFVEPTADIALDRVRREGTLRCHLVLDRLLLHCGWVPGLLNAISGFRCLGLWLYRAFALERSKLAHLSVVPRLCRVL